MGSQGPGCPIRAGEEKPIVKKVESGPASACLKAPPNGRVATAGDRGFGQHKVNPLRDRESQTVGNAFHANSRKKKKQLKRNAPT